MQETAKIIDIEEYKINKIKKQKVDEYSKYPIVGEYYISSEILDEEILEILNVNLDHES